MISLLSRANPTIRASLLLALAVVLNASTAIAHPGAQEKINYLNQQLQTTPDSSNLLRQRGITYSNDGQFEKALLDFRKVETLGAPILVAFDLGVLHYRMGDLKEAPSYFDIVLRHNPKHLPSLEYRARVLRDAGDYKASLADFSRFFALKDNPNPGHFISAAKMLAEQEGNDSINTEASEAALRMLDQGMTKIGLTPQLQRYAIELELEMGRIEMAISRLSSLQTMLGNSSDWNIQMGELLLKADKEQEAHAYFEAASNQLQKLRKTPAREKLLNRLPKLNS